MRARRRRLQGFVARGERHRRLILSVASRIAAGNRDLRNDLKQEGWIAVWEFRENPALPSESMRKIERAAIVRRMQRRARWSRRDSSRRMLLTEARRLSIAAPSDRSEGPDDE
ncbi:MAG: hypothetical protein ABI910_04635 [Gemmatimonadota bacterium]